MHSQCIIYLYNFVMTATNSIGLKFHALSLQFCYDNSWIHRKEIADFIALYGAITRTHNECMASYEGQIIQLDTLKNTVILTSIVRMCTTLWPAEQVCLWWMFLELL